MNELLFFGHVSFMLASLFLALWQGRTALTALIALQTIFANLFVVKQMLFFGFEITCSDVYAIGGILTLNVLQEFFGKEAAQKAIKISFFSSLFFVAMAQIHLLYIASPSDQMHSAFAQIFSSTPRIVFSSIAVYWLVQQFDSRLFSWLQTKLSAFPFRLGLSLALSQVLDTVLFSFFGLYGLVTSLSSIILISLLTKWLAIAFSVPFSTLLKKVRNDRL